MNKYLSKKGYRKDSPHKSRPFNIIPSKFISMKNVEFPVLGIDDLGNQIMMQPGEDYTFPGSYVTEFPIKNMGNKRFAKNGGLLRQSKSQVNRVLKYSKQKPNKI